MVPKAACCRVAHRALSTARPPQIAVVGDRRQPARRPACCLGYTPAVCLFVVSPGEPYSVTPTSDQGVRQLKCQEERPRAECALEIRDADGEYTFQPDKHCMPDTGCLPGADEINARHPTCLLGCSADDPFVDGAGLAVLFLTFQAIVVLLRCCTLGMLPGHSILWRALVRPPAGYRQLQYEVQLRDFLRTGDTSYKS